MYHNKCLFISIFDSNKHLSNYRKSTILRGVFNVYNHLYLLQISLFLKKKIASF